MLKASVQLTFVPPLDAKPGGSGTLVDFGFCGAFEASSTTHFGAECIGGPCILSAIVAGLQEQRVYRDSQRGRFEESLRRQWKRVDRERCATAPSHNSAQRRVRISLMTSGHLELRAATTPKHKVHLCSHW